jgi:hypothetical protein
MESIRMGIAIDEPIGEDDLLWHYTDGAALLNIVNNGVLWATQIQYMNDAQELIHIVEEMRAALELLSDAQEDDFRFVDALAQALGSAALLRVCVLSFSSHRDDLNQWRGYSTHGNGYAVGYRAGDIKAWVEAQRKGDEVAGWALNPVLYRGAVKDAVCHALIQRGRRLRTENEGVLPAFGSMDWTGRNPFFPPALKSLLVNLLHAGPIFKHESFASEAEWRLSTRILPMERLRLRPRGTMMIPYAELVWTDDVVVREVMVGPGPHAALNRTALEVAFGSRLTVSESRVPYRA